MKSKIKQRVILAAAALALLFSFSPALVLADAKSDIQSGVDSVGGNAGSTDLNATAKGAITILSVIVGLVAVIMIVIGGYKYIASAGESTKVSEAKKTILYAVIGLIIVALAQLIVRIVLTKTKT